MAEQLMLMSRLLVLGVLALEIGGRPSIAGRRAAIERSNIASDVYSIADVEFGGSIDRKSWW